jgi:hypothetical protein
MDPLKLLFVVALALGACGPSINAAARDASKAAIDQGAQEITRQDTQQNLLAAAKDPDIAAATEAMTDRIAEGILKALESDRAHAQLASLTKVITDTAARQLVAALGSKATSEQLVGLTNAVTEAALKQVAESLQTEFRPAVQAMMSEDVGQGLATALQSRLQPAFGQTAQTVAYNAVLGANNGLGRAWSSSNGIVRDARVLGAGGLGLLWIPLVLLGMLTLMLIAGAVMMVARARRTRSEVTRLESATLLLATAMRERQATAQTDEIVAIVQHALEGRAERTGRHRILDALKMHKSG